MDLQDRAKQLFPGSPTMQTAWLDAVTYLRNGRGWVYDQVPNAALRTQAQQIRVALAESPPLAGKVTPILKRRGTKS